MDIRKTKKRPNLPRTSRVNDKIIEYYTKFGRDRDLEKFMRLYSPTHSNSPGATRSCENIRSSTTTTASSCDGSSGAEEQGKVFRRLFTLKYAEREHADKDDSGSELSSGVELDSDVKKSERVIPVILEQDEDREAKTTSTSQEDSFATPLKSQKTQSKPAKTPDSVAKTHKRLEWDSLGDIGYIKAMSTSNISILERSILREFFQERSTTATSNKEVVNASEGDLRQKLRRELFLDDNRLEKHPTAVTNTPPLASSTFVDAKRFKAPNGERPIYIANETSTSILPQKNEQYAQTSLERALPTTQSQEIQVNIPAAVLSSTGSATQSSLENALPPSGNENGSSGNGVYRSVSEEYNHPFIASVREILSQRRGLADKSQDRNAIHNTSLANFLEISQDLGKAFDENKENADFKLLDLGIQLLCSLIDAKSLTYKEKKQLVRDIVRRISQLGVSVRDLGKAESAAVSTSERSSKSEARDSKRGRNTSAKSEKVIEATIEKSVRDVPPNKEETQCNSDKVEKLVKVEIYTRGSQPTTPKKGLEKLAKDSKAKESASFKPLAKTKTKTDELISQILFDSKSSTELDANMKKKHLKAASHLTTSSNSSAEDSITNKSVHEKAHSGESDTTMNEWLNPLTQSEIEYEQRKRELIAKQHEEKKRKHGQELTEKSEREVQLNWIDTEIQRLESLKNLLLKENTSSGRRKTYNTEKDLKENKPPKSDAQSNTHLSDPVYSESKNLEKSSTIGSKSSTEQVVQEIEVIIEESNEDEVNFQTNLKRTKERTRETQITYDNPNLVLEATGGVPTGRARFTTVKETITTHEEHMIPIESPEQASVQRSKINTPYSSNGSESVRSFVQQRKRQFMEHYNKKKKTQCEAPKQKKDFQENTQQSKATESAMPPTHADDHYSVPISEQRNYDLPSRQEQNVPEPTQWQRHNIPSTAAPRRYHSPPKTRGTRFVSYSASAGVARVHTSDNKNNTHSSSSMLAVSSEVSIPMGSNSTSSNTTTTHQYDDVANVGVPIPPTDFLHKRPPPFSRHHCQQSDTHEMGSTWKNQRNHSTGAAYPKSVAYVISFGAAKTAPRNSDAPNSNKLTLQQHLQLSKPKFCADSKERKAVLNKIQALRQERERELRNIMENTSLQSLDRKLNALPPPPTKIARIVSTKEMKAITNKRYARLPEVLNKQKNEREERHRRGNRIMRDVFNKRLQKRVRDGKLSLNHSGTVI